MKSRKLMVPLIPDSIPLYEKLEKRFLCNTKINYIVVSIIGVLSIILLQKLLFLYDPEIYTVLITSLLFKYISIWDNHRPIFTLEKINISHKTPDKKVGAFSHKQILSILDETLKEFKNREIPNIYITDTIDANAFVTDSLLFNFIKPLNAVYISKKLFSVLGRDELKAIISHELGHFYAYMSPVARVSFVPSLFSAILPVFIAHSFGELALTIPLWLVSHVVSEIAISLWLNNSPKTLEYLSDHFAAQRHGKLNMINALVSMLKYTEFEQYTMKQVVDRIKSDSHLSISQLPVILDLIYKRLPDKPFSKKELNSIIKETFKTEEFRQKRSKLSKFKLIQEKNAIKDFTNSVMLNKKFEIIDWNLFDFIKKDMRISPAEYPSLIKALLENPEQQLFNIPSDNLDQTKKGSHPTLRERILFLEKSGL